MSIKKRLEDYIAEAENSIGTGKKIGFDSLTSEEVNELLELADENGVIEMDGVKIQIVKPGEALPEEVVEDLVNSLDEDKLKEILRGPSLTQMLSHERAHENTDKLIDFLTDNDMNFVDLLIATINLGISGYSDDSVGIGGIQDTNDYFEYISEIKTEMLATQATLPTNPIINVEDLMNASLLSALDCLTASKEIVDHMIHAHRLASLAEKERVKELTASKYEAVKEVIEISERAEQSDEIKQQIIKEFESQTGMNAEEVMEQIRNGVPTSKISEKIKSKSADMKVDSQEVC